MQAQVDPQQLAKIQRSFVKMRFMIQQDELIKAMEEWAQLVEMAAKKFVPVKIGTLRDRINHFVFKMTLKEITMKVSTRPKGYKPKSGDIAYEYFLEYGTVPHFIFPTKKAALSWVEEGNRYFSKGHMVSGIMATMFMQRAYLTTRTQGKALVRKALIVIINRANRG